MVLYSLNTLSFHFTTKCFQTFAFQKCQNVLVFIFWYDIILYEHYTLCFCVCMRSAWDYSLLPLVAYLLFLTEDFEECLEILEKYEENEEDLNEAKIQFITILRAKCMFLMVRIFFDIPQYPKLK